ncbi:MAG: dynamin family protein [Pseudomonadota bacterium]|nr:dynamin family protein [Pseudomonadota bacterium]
MLADATRRCLKLEDFFKQTEGLDFYADLNIQEERNRLSADMDQIRSKPFRVAVIGEFSSGKSTFINAILKEALLPAAYAPTTNQVMCITHSAELRQVCVAGDESCDLPLTQENIRKLGSETDGWLDIATSIPVPMDQFVIYDTPGVNDPSSLSEEVIFDLLGKSDVIVFMMRADGALKETERVFLHKLVLKKDLGKFFFVINYADNLEPGDAADVRTHVVTQLAQLLEWPMKDAEDRVFLYSAKQSLAAGLTGKSTETAVYLDMHDQLLGKLQAFSVNRAEELVAVIADGKYMEVVKAVSEKLSAAIDKAENRDGSYLEALDKINSEMNVFRSEIQEEEFAFREVIRAKKRKLIQNIEQEFSAIREEIRQDILKSQDSNATEAAWVQKRVRNLVDDKVSTRVEAFALEIKNASSDFGQKILPSLERSIQNINGIQKSYDYSSLAAGVGVATVGYFAVAAALPWLIGGVIVTAAGGAVLSAVPGVGVPAMVALAANGVSGLGSLMSSGGGVLRWSYNRMKVWIYDRKYNQDRQRFADETDKSILSMQHAVTAKLESEIDPIKISAVVVEKRLPQESELLERQQKEIFVDRKRLGSYIDEMRLRQRSLLELAHTDSLRG